MNIRNNGAPVRMFEMETGEDIGIEVNSGDMIRVIRGESIASFKALLENSVVINSGREFIKQFPEISERLCNALTPQEMWLLTALIPYVGANSGVLKLSNGEFLSRRHIVERYHNVSDRTIERSLSGLVEKGVLAKCYVKNKRAFIMNPYVLHRGSKANATLLTLFSKTEWMCDHGK